MQIDFRSAGIALTCLVREPCQAGAFGFGLPIRLNKLSDEATRTLTVRQKPGTKS